MEDNTQNTISGTANGGAILTPTGNKYIDALAGLSNVAGNVLNNVSSFQERKYLMKARARQAVEPPQQQSIPSIFPTQADNALLIKQMALYFGGAALLTMLLLNGRR